MGSTEISKKFADRLSDLIESAKKKGHDYRFLAREIEISPAALSNYANAKQQPNVTTLYKIAKYFNVSADWLIGLSDFPRKEMEEISLSKIDLPSEVLLYLVSMSEAAEAGGKEADQMLKGFAMLLKQLYFHEIAANVQAIKIMVDDAMNNPDRRELLHGQCAYWLHGTSFCFQNLVADITGYDRLDKMVSAKWKEEIDAKLMFKKEDEH